MKIRASRTRRSPAAPICAALLMFALVATNFPLIAIAETTDAPAAEAAVDTQTVDETAKDETPKPDAGTLPAEGEEDDISTPLADDTTPIDLETDTETLPAIGEEGEGSAARGMSLMMTSTAVVDDGKSSITIVKETLDGTGTFSINVKDAGPPAPESFDWTAKITTTAPNTETTSEEDGFQFLPPGTYDVSEAVPEGWELVSASCSGEGNSELDGDSLTITVSQGEDVTCTFVNEKIATPGQCVIVSDTTTLEGGDAAVLLDYIHASWTAIIASASWIWGENHALGDASADAAVEIFTRTFTLSEAVASSTLLIAADNGYSIKLNGQAIGSDAGEFNYNLAGQDVITVTPNKFNVGVNTLEITVTNKSIAKTWKDNPAGLYYKLTIDGSNCGTVDPEPETSTVTMCKVNQNDQPLSGWELMLAGEKVGDTEVKPDGNAYSVNNLPAGTYVIKAQGAYTYRADAVASTSDAAYSYRLPSDAVYGGPYAPWVRVNNFPSPYTGWLGVMLNGGFTDWGSVFKEDHTYTLATTTTATSNLAFSIQDDQYGDNSGYIDVSVRKGYVGTTGEDGCVTFKNVPFGKYETGEIMQEGWENVSGLDIVQVDDTEETFTVVNRDLTPTPTTVTVHIYKHLKDANSIGQVVNGANVPDFPMTATWNATNIGVGSGNYVLGNSHGGATFEHAANTSPMSAPADYTTSEVTDGSVVIAVGGQCVADKYRLVGYKWGTSYADAQATTTISTIAPVFTDITSDRYVIVVNEDCDTIIDGGPTSTFSTTTVTALNLAGWEFNSDRNTWTMGTGDFVAGPETAPLGNGSARLTTPTNDDRTKLRMYLAAGTQISDITQLKYSTYRLNPDGGALTLALQFDIDFDGTPVDPTKADARIVYEPYHTQQASILDDEWQQWDAMDDAAGTGTGSWWIAGPNPSVCPQSNPCTWAELNTAYPDMQISAESLENTIDTQGAVLFKAGGSWAGFEGMVDEFIFGLKTGSNTHTTTYDFEPAQAAPEETVRRGGGGGGGFSSASARRGEVLGATTAACEALLSTFMRMGQTNDTAEVIELQGFLNEHMGAALPLTGVFGPLTDAAVHAFQKKYWEDVLKPWFAIPEAGIDDAADSTGYVFKSTQWKINDIYCPDVAAFPALP